MIGRARLLLPLILSVAGCALRPPPVLQFGVIGDLQYDAREERAFPYLIDAMNAEPLAFVVHLGDFKSGGAPCTDALFESRRRDFERSRHAFILIPGDNDWVDCRRRSNGSMDPLERLAKLREVFYRDRMSLGAERFELERQSARGGEFTAYRENAMWLMGGVVFATLNIQGSNDNVGFDAASDAEQRIRLAANIAWMREAFDRARRKDARGVVFFQQANPGFELSQDEVRQSAWAESTRAFEELALAAGLPVLYVHGDTHTFRVEHPYRSPLDKRALPNVTRLEGFGNPHIDWVRVQVLPTRRENPFRIEAGGFVPPE
jgi:hypothetical protein